MSSIKCKSCGLTNFASETQCRRCGDAFLRSPQREKAPRSFSLTSLLIPAVAAVGFYYVFVGSGSSAGEIPVNGANRTASQPVQPEPSGETRMVLDRQRANHIGNTMNLNPSLDAHQKRVADSQKMMEQITNSSQK
jgi:ribosomal protein L40E